MMITLPSWSISIVKATADNTCMHVNNYVYTCTSSYKGIAMYLCKGMAILKHELKLTACKQNNLYICLYAYVYVYVAYLCT